MGAAHQLNKYIKNLAQICHPLRSILKKVHTKESKFIWTEEHEQAFEKLKNEIKKIVENSHFRNDTKTRVTGDASREGLGAILEQNFNGEWRPIACSSRF